jgi:hypothetical protein
MNFQALPKISAENGKVTPPPDWCPLAPHPSFAKESSPAGVKVPRELMADKLARINAKSLSPGASALMTEIFEQPAGVALDRKVSDETRNGDTK